MKQQEFEKKKEYKYGFTTDIESIRAPKGLNEGVIKFISEIKKEPKWMLDWRLSTAVRKCDSLGVVSNMALPKIIDPSKNFVLVRLI